ncbi:MAG: DNA-processing protein DprA [Peptoniphilaceae bacterium]|nr:DNA-processing protein DprA [Peptoniphilaceae bacterium]MDY6085557.1 DNA-processing protein DprA [Peptoniphilaceae bacterium]
MEKDLFAVPSATPEPERLSSEEILLLALQGLYPEQIAALDAGTTVIGTKKPKHRWELLTRDAEREALLSKWAQLRQMGYWSLQRGDAAFPPLLKEIAMPPFVLFGRGKVEALQTFCIAIVGTRNPSHYGEDIALRFGEELARRGATVVSGLAYGIDALAHRGALNAEAVTVAVLGSGIDRIYPATHQRLADAILEQGGCIVSEYPPGMRPYPHHFLRRNRLISGLSRGVLVVEAGKRSGTMSTVTHAEEQNRDVFCIPGNVDQPRSEGTNGLIQKGAALVMDPLDIVHAYYDWPKPGVATKARFNDALTRREQEIDDRLKAQPLTAEALRRSINVDASTLWSALTLMEMKGRIWQSGDGRFHRYQTDEPEEGCS